MNTSTATPQQAVRTALEKLEMSVETPLVPGEMERWIGAVSENWQTLVPLLQPLITEQHLAQFQEIRQEDPGLTHRVERMQAEDEGIEQAAEALGRQIEQMKLDISKGEPDEASLKPELKHFVGDVLRFIIRVRMQEQAVRTWLQEAFMRDRGTVD